MSYTVKQARVGINATQKEMADKMAIHVTTYQKLEKNSGNMTIAQANLFASIVGLPLADIFFVK